MNKILIIATALFFGFGIMLASGSIIGDSERHLKEYIITEIAFTENESNYIFSLEDYISALDAAYIYNNVDTLYFMQIEDTYTQDIIYIQNSTILDSNYTLDTAALGDETAKILRDTDVSGQLAWWIQTDTPNNYDMYINTLPYTYNSTSIDFSGTNSVFTVTFQWQLEEFTTLGNLANVATIVMVVAIISTASYLALKGRASA